MNSNDGSVARLAARPALLTTLTFLSFVSLGLPDGLLGVAWPSMRTSFGLGNEALGALFASTTIGYVVSSLFTGPLLNRLGLAGLLAASCTATAISLLGYAFSTGWTAVLAFGLLAGAGGGAIDAGLNAHAAASFTPRMLNLLHAFYGLGTTVGPLLMTRVLALQAPWQRGYVIVAGAQLLLAACFAVTRRRWPTAQSAAHDAMAGIGATLRFRAARWSMLVFFCYVGLEAAAGAWTFAILSESRGVDPVVAGIAVSLYWCGLFAGRLLFALMPAWLRTETLVGPCLWVAVAAVAVFAADIGTVGNLAALVLLGIASGPVFPLLISATPGRLGPAHTANAVGLQVAASALGLALVPAAFGGLAAAAGLEQMPAAMLGLWLLLGMVYRRLLRSSPTRNSHGLAMA